ncbi:MAG: hypothetical protein WCL44_00175 [bacterium]
MKRFVAAIAIISALCCVWGCDNGDEVLWGCDSNLVGSWREENPTYFPYFHVTFNADGSLVMLNTKGASTTESGIWHTEGTKLVISMKSKAYSDEYEYRLMPDKLYMTTIDGYEIVCRKVQ